MAETDLSCEFVRRLFSFDAARGLLVWNRRPVSDFKDKGKQSAEWIAKAWNTRSAGKIAGHVTVDGYRTITIDKTAYLGHRLIWFYATGGWPNGQLDHIHGTGLGDVMSNLREATQKVNCQNRRLRNDSTSGVVGIYWDIPMNKWRAQIYAMDKHIYLGCFTDKSEAIAVRRAAEIKYGFHPNHGRKVA